MAPERRRAAQEASEDVSSLESYAVATGPVAASRGELTFGASGERNGMWALSAPGGEGRDATARRTVG